jgi:hypothetical protein
VQEIIPTILLKQLEQLNEEICFANPGKEGDSNEMREE